MSWEYVEGLLVIEFFPAALALTAAVIGVLLLMRHLSLKVLKGAPDYGDLHRYTRGAQWGWLVAVLSFLAVIATVSMFFGYATWDFRATALAWMTALLPVAGSIGFLLMPEFMGHWVWAQAIWDELGGKSIDWPQYRALTSRLESDGARWTYYAAWVVGSVALTAGPLWTYTLVAG